MGVTKGKTRIERNVLSALLLIVVFYLFSRIRVSKGYEPLIKICTLKTEHDIGMFLNL